MSAFNIGDRVRVSGGFIGTVVGAYVDHRPHGGDHYTVDVDTMPNGEHLEPSATFRSLAPQSLTVVAE